MKVIPSEEGVRLQRWMQQHYPALAYSVFQKCLRQGRILVNGVPVRSNVSLCSNQDIQLVDCRMQQENRSTSDPIAHRNHLEALVYQLRTLVCHEETRFLALNKPVGFAVQGGSKIHHSIDTLLRASFIVTGERLLLVHRLDQMTSGLLLIAKGRTNAEHFASLFKERRAQKTYLAVTHGIPSPRKGHVSAPIIKKRFAREERIVVDYQFGQSAETAYCVQETCGPYALLKLHPLTGRTHQLRVHCASILKTPIVGDSKYGNEYSVFKKEKMGMMLHANQLHLPGLPVLTAPIPERFFVFIKGSAISKIR
ncbi:MAG: RluA family pseudouridine synthase [Holosporales bacterium]|nr:RluA family pseudouridine synthase [Holosporales bacterium]